MVGRWALDTSQPLLLCSLKPESLFVSSTTGGGDFFSDSEKELDPI